MGDASIFVDESGGQGGHSKYYVLTLVFHGQAEDIEADLEKCHHQGLEKRGLAEIPFHMGPLMTGHDDYGGGRTLRRGRATSRSSSSSCSTSPSGTSPSSTGAASSKTRQTFRPRCAAT